MDTGTVPIGHLKIKEPGWLVAFAIVPSLYSPKTVPSPVSSPTGATIYHICPPMCTQTHDKQGRPTGDDHLQTLHSASLKLTLISDVN